MNFDLYCQCFPAGESVSLVTPSPIITITSLIQTRTGGKKSSENPLNKTRIQIGLTNDPTRRKVQLCFLLLENNHSFYQKNNNKHSSLY